MATVDLVLSIDADVELDFPHVSAEAVVLSVVDTDATLNLGD